MRLPVFGKPLRMIGFLATKNTMIMIYLSPISCRVIGMISAGDRSNILEHGQKY
jgi:hypothetical protein